jgi:hypothetical protein
MNKILYTTLLFILPFPLFLLVSHTGVFGSYFTGLSIFLSLIGVFLFILMCVGVALLFKIVNSNQSDNQKQVNPLIVIAVGTIFFIVGYINAKALSLFVWAIYLAAIGFIATGIKDLIKRQ